MDLLRALPFLIPLFLGIAVVTDYRGFSKMLTQSSRRSSTDGPARGLVITGWVFIVVSSLVILSGIVTSFAG